MSVVFTFLWLVDHQFHFPLFFFPPPQSVFLFIFLPFPFRGTFDSGKVFSVLACCPSFFLVTGVFILPCLFLIQKFFAPTSQVLLGPPLYPPAVLFLILNSLVLSFSGAPLLFNTKFF